MVRYRDTNAHDLSYLSRHLRKQDRVEVEIASGMSAEAVLMMSWRDSKRTWVATVDDTPVAIFGIAEHSREIGVPWLLGTDGMVHHRRALIRDALSIVEDMQRAYRTLANMTHAGNTVALYWLRHLGFTLGQQFVHNNHPFIPFFRYSHV